MLNEYKAKTNVGVALGVATQLAGAYFMEAEDGNDVMAVAGMTLLLLGIAFWTWGCMSYAAGKGHSKWYGLLGLFSCVGLLVLIVLPDRHPRA